MLLANKAEASLCNNKGLNSLYIASQFGHHVIVRELLRKDVKLCDTCSENPLSAATCFGHYKTVEILLQNGANVNVQNDDGDTPLITACKKGWCDIVKILLNFGADVNLCNEDDENALHCACLKGHTDIVEILLNCGMDINGNDSYTPLQQALFGEHMTTALFLLDHGANVNIVTYGTSALYLACEARFKELVNILLERNAEVNPKNTDDSPADSPLVAAVRNEHFQITKELLRRGANIVKTNRLGDESLLAMAIENKNLGIVKLLIEYGANVNEQDKHGNTALHASAYHTDNLDYMTVLLNNNAKTNVRNYIGTTPLMMALYNNPETIERVQALLSHGADVNARDNSGCSPLHCACLWPDEHNVVPYLLENGADINAQDEKGETALYVTCFHGFLKNVKTLVRCGADINLRTKVGLRPLDIAKEMGYTNIQNFLTQNMDEERNSQEKKTSSKSGNSGVSISQREVVVVKRSALAPVLPRKRNPVKLPKTWQQKRI